MRTALFVCALLPRLAPALQLPEGLPGRRSALAQAAAAATAAGPAALALLAGAPLPALAEVRGANSGMPTGEVAVNKFLASKGLPPMAVPSGCSALVEYIGTAPPANIDGMKTKLRPYDNTLLVRFVFPSGWLVEAPTITENGEAGNIAAGNYGKGDSCVFAALALPSGGSLGSLPKSFYTKWLTSQMSADVFEDVKIKALKPATRADGTEMVDLDFTYTLLTRAGFTVVRRGIASAMVADGAVVGVVSATTEMRYKELEKLLRATADSFRAYKVKAPAFPGSVV